MDNGDYPYENGHLSGEFPTWNKNLLWKKIARFIVFYIYVEVEFNYFK